jgi:hypothetical protein
VLSRDTGDQPNTSSTRQANADNFDPNMFLRDLSPVSDNFNTINMPLPFLNSFSDGDLVPNFADMEPGDFSWLMPGGHVPYYQSQ